MKKTIVLLLAAVALFSGISAFAQGKQQPSEKEQLSNDWEMISFCFFPGLPEPANFVKTCGLKLGIPVSFGDTAVTNGIDAALFVSFSQFVNGIQAAPFYCETKELNGLQASLLANVSTNRVNGLQFAIFNYAEKGAFQIGIVNIIKDSSLPFMLFVNCYY